MVREKFLLKDLKCLQVKMTSQQDLEEKIRNLENENSELKQEKLNFEDDLNEMNTKMEELEYQLEQIRLQLQTIWKYQIIKLQKINLEKK